MGLFSSPKNKTAAKHISIESPAAARKSVAWLEKQVSQLVRYANTAANRAKAQLRRKNLSSKERKEMREVYKIFRAFVNKHKKGSPAKSSAKNATKKSTNKGKKKNPTKKKTAKKKNTRKK